MESTFHRWQDETSQLEGARGVKFYATRESVPAIEIELNSKDTQELTNMWMRTGQPGLWFIAGSFAQCRIYSKYLGMQIKACLEGLIPPQKPAT